MHGPAGPPGLREPTALHWTMTHLSGRQPDAQAVLQGPMTHRSGRQPDTQAVLQGPMAHLSGWRTLPKAQDLACSMQPGRWVPAEGTHRPHEALHLPLRGCHRGGSSSSRLQSSTGFPSPCTAGQNPAFQASSTRCCISNAKLSPGCDSCCCVWKGCGDGRGCRL